ncbi:MAG TPA: MAPEG family protein [Sphingomonas sp.]|uniref:MAPEG family protein n=1 Tax=Sphingomonas sp. TaxID=28214 RepID=UPI002C0F660A|nr:MAPEG family protein [Sphingomonas sp.]HMI19434.1 MAPEG family protein [Sphingomonas sp.]
MSTAILWPTFLLVGLIFAVVITMATKRFSYIRSTRPKRENFATSAAQKAYFAPVDSAAHNLANLFELPVLFLALVPLLLVFRHADHIQVGLAWLFVALRGLHSFVHIKEGRALFRFRAYLGSCVVLSVMWVGFAIDMATASIALANAG